MKPSSTPAAYPARATVHVVGFGARTALGADAASSTAAVRAAVANFTEHPFMIDSVGRPMIVARAPYLREDLSGAERFAALGRAALDEALAPVARRQPPSIPLILGLPVARPGLPDDLAERLRPSFAIAPPGGRRPGDFTTIALGHAAGVSALAAGIDRIRRGDVELCVTGGVDSYLEPDTLQWLEATDQLHGAGALRNAYGFVPGEAAAFCVLASQRAVGRHGWPSLARVVSTFVGREENRIRTDTICTGKGLSAAFWGALAGVADDLRIDHLFCDLNGETYRADELGFTLARTAARFVGGGTFSAPAQCWGDVGAASAPLFVTLAIAAGRKGYARGPYSLLSTSADGGERGAAIVHVEAREIER